jgi:hypothetical protein
MSYELVGEREIQGLKRRWLPLAILVSLVLLLCLVTIGSLAYYQSTKPVEVPIPIKSNVLLAEVQPQVAVSGVTEDVEELKKVTEALSQDVQQLERAKRTSSDSTEKATENVSTRAEKLKTITKSLTSSVRDLEKSIPIKSEDRTEEETNKSLSFTTIITQINQEINNLKRISIDLPEKANMARKLVISPKEIDPKSKRSDYPKSATLAAKEDFSGYFIEGLSAEVHYLEKVTNNLSEETTALEKAKREASPSSQSDLTRAIKEQLNELVPGVLLLKFPHEMIVGVPQVFSVLIAEEQVKDVYMQGFQGTGELDKGQSLIREPIKVGTLMSVDLKGDKFKIQPEDSKVQPVTNLSSTTWDWQVTPLEPGMQSLFFTISLNLTVPEHSGFDIVKNHPIHQETIKVRVNPIRSIKSFTQQNWLSLAITTIVGTIAISIAKYQPLATSNQPISGDTTVQTKPNVSSHPTMQTILFLAANPKDTGRLRLDQELRDIAEGLQRAQKRDQFNLEQRLAVRPQDIERAILDVSPQIIHFSGHGAGEQGLVFEDEIGNAKLVDGAALAGLFELFADQIHCVVLNGCYSEVQAKEIAQHIPYVIGMNQEIGDRAAIAFAVGFYDALGAGRDVEFAYNLGCAVIRLEGIAGNLTPVLLKQSTTRDATVQPKPFESTPPAPPTPTAAREPIEVFISYSHKDEDLKDELYIHLANLTRQGKIKPWQDRAIEAGTEWDAEIKARLESAGVILLLITPRFIASEYCFDKEMQRAMDRHATGTARVIPIIMKPCDWQDTPFSKLQVLPKDAKPVTSWSDQDEALLNVVQGIRKAVDSLKNSSPFSSERSH